MSTRAHKKSERGLTLIELLVSIVIALVAIAAALTIYYTTVQNGLTSIRSTRINTDVEGAIILMQNELRRASFTGSARAGYSPSTENQFNLQAPVTIGNSDTCITYSYDSNPEDGAIQPTELYGFRLQGGAIEMRISGTDVAQATNCSHGTWLPMTLNDGNEPVTVTELLFAADDFCDDVDDTSNTASNASCSAVIAAAASSTGARLVNRRAITISVTAVPVRDNAMIKQSTASVNIANDSVQVVP